MRRGPQARTDIENEEALADLATGRTSRRSTRKTAIVEPEPDDIESGALVVRDGRLEVETPKRNSKPKSSGAWAAGRGRWKCCTCGTWTRDPAHRACLACRELENQI